MEESPSCWQEISNQHPLHPNSLQKTIKCGPLQVINEVLAHRWPKIYVVIWGYKPSSRGYSPIYNWFFGPTLYLHKQPTQNRGRDHFHILRENGRYNLVPWARRCFSFVFRGGWSWVKLVRRRFGFGGFSWFFLKCSAHQIGLIPIPMIGGGFKHLKQKFTPKRGEMIQFDLHIPWKSKTKQSGWSLG